jgi:NAD(P)-dependent dehydrogenase (short-subunit alcohol dehydrogenase family)
MKILVTGGASGVGASITRRLAELPGNEIYFTFNLSGAEAGRLEEGFPNASSMRCNFSNDEDLQSLMDKMAVIDPDVLINNAWTGILQKHFHLMGRKDVEHDFMNNLLPTIQLTQRAIKLFRKKKFGKIITILSSYIVGNPPVGYSAYVANKNYLYSMAKSWAVENVRHNITSNCISPSFMRTNMNQSTDSRIIEEMEDSHPLKKLLTTEEVADTVAYLVQASQQINGINFIINSASAII